MWHMENNTFKSVTFGGFDKQDVIRYIEQSAREAAEIQERLQQENDGLRAQVQTLEERAAELERRAEEAESRCHGLEQQISQERTARQALEQEKQVLEAEKAKLQTLADEAQRLRPEAESYAQFRDRVGDIEGEAHKRAAALEAATVARMRQASDAFQTQYQALMSSFETTASHVTGELRKIEVTLAQLPRAMDQPGAELKELKEMLERSGESR